jgi:UDP-N-acetylmuramoyl-tripeptide--D-alanyl-D-alanine ligase
MPRHNVSDFLKVTKASVVQQGESDFFGGARYDSRVILNDFMFIAVVGEKSDGHCFVEAATQNGASVVLGSKSVKADKHVTVLLHPNPIHAIQNYANWYRNQLSTTFIGITGSYGKTTTKDFLGSLLPNSYKSLGNLNNTLGLPLCLLEVESHHDFAVMECGISKPGEMQELANILEPDLTIITAIGMSHHQFFETILDLAKEKFSLARAGKVKTVFIDQKVNEEFSSLLPTGVELKVTKPDTVDLPQSINIFGIGPTLCFKQAWLVAHELVENLQLEGLRELNQSRTSLRMEVKVVNEIRYVLDCYNASPESMLAFLESMPNDSLIVLADMLELGNVSDKEHFRVLTQVLSLGFKNAVLLGEQFAKASQQFEGSPFIVVQNRDQILPILKNCDNSCIGFKGSRAFELEKVYKQIEKEAVNL